MFKKYFFVILFFCHCLTKAQHSIRFIRQEDLYQKAFLNYQNRYYLITQDILERMQQSNALRSSMQESMDYYKVLSSVKQNSKDAEFWIDYFIKKYPTSIFKNNFLLEIGNYYYHSKNSTIALKWLSKVDKKFLNQPQEDAYNFTMGHALFSLKDYTQAIIYFLPLTYRSIYKENACYYYGYISYLQFDYSVALRYFKKISNPALKKMVIYYRMVIHYQRKDYEKVIALQKEFKKNDDKNLTKKVYLILAHSYFQTKKYVKAIEYFQKVLQKITKTDYLEAYICGYAFSKIGQYDKGLEYFQKVLSVKKDNQEFLQNTTYHMARCHLKLNNKSAALLAFKKVSQIPSKNYQLQKDAHFNYAKLSYQIGNPYQNATEVLKSYVLKYPNAINTLQIKKLIVDSYFKAQDFKGVLAYYQQAKIPADEKKQKAFLFLGMKLFQNANYKEALVYFKKVSNQLFDLKIRSQGIYWTANTLYELQDFKKALLTYIQFYKQKNAKDLEPYKQANYNIAYTYFKLKRYDKAAIYFERYHKTNDKDTRKINDSYLRLADSYFADKKYKKAIKNYNHILTTSGIKQDYAHFQKALCYGFINRQNLKIQTLISFGEKYPESTYQDEVLFTLGNTYLQVGRYKEALKTYQKLIATFDKSPFFALAMLKKGLIYYNLGDSEKALKQYKLIVEKFPKTSIAQQAIANIKRVYVETDQAEKYVAWIKTVNFVNVSDSDLDDTMYQAAEALYLEHKVDRSINSFEKYLSNFPLGLHNVKVHFYLAQLYFGKKDWESALPHYTFVIEQNTNIYLEKSLAKLSEIYLIKKNWQQAFIFLKKIVEQAHTPTILLFAKKNLVKVTYEIKAYQSCIDYATNLLENHTIDDKVTNDVTFYIAKSAIKLENFPLSEKMYARLLNASKPTIKAEAMYHQAYFLHMKKLYKNSNQSIQKMAEHGVQDMYWNAKSLLLMAQNYMALKDTFQTNYILEHLSKNTEIPDELLIKINHLSKQIKQQKSANNDEDLLIDTLKVEQ